MRHMGFIKHTEDYGNAAAPPALYEEMGKFIEKTTKSGTSSTAPASAGTRVRLKAGKITVTDGPFAESKEIVGGYAIMDAKSREETLKATRARSRGARRRRGGAKHRSVPQRARPAHSQAD